MIAMTTDTLAGFLIACTLLVALLLLIVMR